MTGRAKRLPEGAFALIFAWAVGDESSPGYPNLNRRLVYHLVPFFIDKRAGEIDQGDVKHYIEVRRSTWSLQTKAGYSTDTARDELRHLRKIVDAYTEAALIADVKHKWKVSGKTVRYVSSVHDRDDVVRLLRAARGWEWDADGGRMRLIAARWQRLFNRRAFSHTRRYILLATLSGTKEDCARRLRWSPHPEGGVSYVDLEAGTLHRLGPDAPDFPKFKGVPINVPKSLLGLMRTWRTADAKSGFELVVHMPDGSPVKSSLKQALRSIATYAGLEGVSPQSLIDTCAATALERGAPLFGVAMMIGLGPVPTRRRYDHFRSDLHERALKALDTPLDSKPRHVAGTSASGRSEAIGAP